MWLRALDIRYDGVLAPERGREEGGGRVSSFTPGARERVALRHRLCTQRQRIREGRGQREESKPATERMGAEQGRAATIVLF